MLFYFLLPMGKKMERTMTEKCVCFLQWLVFFPCVVLLVLIHLSHWQKVFPYAFSLSLRRCYYHLLKATAIWRLSVGLPNQDWVIPNSSITSITNCLCSNIPQLLASDCGSFMPRLNVKSCQDLTFLPCPRVNICSIFFFFLAEAT